MWLAVCFACALVILADRYVLGHRQHMAIMTVVWPVTALYFGPLAVWAYLRYGREPHRDKPGWATVAIGVSHCGAGCTLGDIIAEWAVFALGWTVAGEAVYASMIGDYLLAIALGIVFQYLAIAPMQGLGLRDGLKRAAKADVLSLTAFEIGLFAWMALTAFVFFPAPHQVRADSPVFWLMMQVGMILGFATAWPANVWLIRRGIKEAM